jgi:hypothetical protein
MKRILSSTVALIYFLATRTLPGGHFGCSEIVSSITPALARSRSLSGDPPKCGADM